MLKIHVLRAATESDAQAGGAASAGSWLCTVRRTRGLPPTSRSSASAACGSLCEWAHSEGLDVAWKDAHSVYQDARQRYKEPITTREEIEALSIEEQRGVFAGAYLTR